MRRRFAVVAGTSLDILNRAQTLFDSRNIRDVQTAVFVCDDLHPSVNQIEKLATSQQVIGVAGASIFLIAAGKSLIDQYATRSDGVDKARHQRPEEVVDDYDCVKCHGSKWPAWAEGITSVL